MHHAVVLKRETGETDGGPVTDRFRPRAGAGRLGERESPHELDLDRGWRMRHGQEIVTRVSGLELYGSGHCDRRSAAPRQGASSTSRLDRPTSGRSIETALHCM